MRTGFEITGAGRLAGLGWNPVSIGSAVHRIIENGIACAAFVSPQGDCAATASLLIARDTADLGLRTVLVDLTVSGVASRSMLGPVSPPGITDLLAGAAELGNAIHPDRCGGCHVIPVGTVAPALAMRSAHRLALLLRSLVSAYDVVVVECGPAGLRGLRWLGSGDIDMFVSVAGIPGPMVEENVRDIRERFPDAGVVAASGCSSCRG